MASFEIAHKITMKNEGGYTSNPDDNGNWTGGKKYSGTLIGTNWGISAPMLCKFLNRIATVDEMRNLSKDTARLIYKRNFWDVMRGDEWNNQENANNVYDMCVNTGCQAAITVWQISLGIKPITGKMDDHTLNITNLKK